MNTFQQAILLFEDERLVEAISVCKEILLANAKHADALQMIGLAHAKLGDLTEAIVSMEKAVESAPNSAVICNNLGELYRQQGRLADAERVLLNAIELRPRFAEAALNLGNTLKALDRNLDAITWFRRAVEWKPDYANAYLNLANTLRVEGYFEFSIKRYNEYLKLAPARVDILLSLGGAHAELGERSAVSACFERAALLEPDNPLVDEAIGHDRLAQGDCAEALKRYRRIAARAPANLLKQLRCEIVCETIIPHSDYVDEYRRTLLDSLDKLDSSVAQFEARDLTLCNAEPPMVLAYQGRDDRQLKERYAQFFEKRIEPLELNRRSGAPHVGFVVTQGHEGVYAKCLGPLVNRLAERRKLQVSVVCSRAAANILPSLLGQSVVTYLPLCDDVESSAKKIRDVGIDHLHYWEVGTDSTNYFLPFFRPAAIQSACWGWPVTTGQSRVDYFVSGKQLEPVEGASHYTEKLICLQTFPTWYQRPPTVNSPRSRKEIGWPEKARIYLCTQNLRKYHPDFDAVIAKILRTDAEGFVYGIDDERPSIGKQLSDRFKTSFPDVASRFVLIPRQLRLAYLNYVLLADVILDTLHYGGGANSLYDAMACGTPFVTRPGMFHRSRYGQAVCERLNLRELVTSTDEEYVNRAIDIACNSDLRETLKQRILERCPILFEEELAIQEYEHFLLQTIAQVR